MNRIFVVLLALLPIIAYSAPATPSPWIFDTITDAKGVAGYIYHSYSVGTMYSDGVVKNVTNLRLICPARGKAPAIVAVYWDGQDDVSNTNIIEISIDRKIFIDTQMWMHDRSLQYRPLNESGQLIIAMRNAKMIEFKWFDISGVQKETIFDLTNFKSHLDEFYTSCKI